MRDYPVKRGFKKKLEGAGLKKVMEEYFEGVREYGEEVHASYGAMHSIKARYDGKRLWVETETDPKADDELALDTIRNYNKFLEKATGYTAKERKKLANKEAKGE